MLPAYSVHVLPFVPAKAISPPFSAFGSIRVMMTKTEQIIKIGVRVARTNHSQSLAHTHTHCEYKSFPWLPVRRATSKINMLEGVAILTQSRFKYHEPVLWQLRQGIFEQRVKNLVVATPNSSHSVWRRSQLHVCPTGQDEKYCAREEKKKKQSPKIHTNNKQNAHDDDDDKW